VIAALHREMFAHEEAHENSNTRLRVHGPDAEITCNKNGWGAGVDVLEQKFKTG